MLYRIHRTNKVSRVGRAAYAVWFLLTRRRSIGLLRLIARRKLEARPAMLAKYHPAVKLRRVR